MPYVSLYRLVSPSGESGQEASGTVLLGLDAAQRLAAVLAQVPCVTVRRWRKGTAINAARSDLAVDLVAGEVPWRLEHEAARALWGW